MPGPPPFRITALLYSKGTLWRANLRALGFQEVVKEAWEKPIQATDSIRRLHIKLTRMAKALNNWEKNNVGNIKMQLTIIKEVIWQLDRAQERHDLSKLKVEFRARIKEIYLGLLALEKVRARQRSRISNFKDTCKQTGPTSSTNGFTEPKCLCQKEVHS
jgi:hypothetical protein